MSFEESFAHFRAGRLAEAEDGLRRVVAAEPARAEAHELLGLVLGTRGRPREALACFERALQLRPGAPGLRHNRAQALFALGRFDEARAALEPLLAEQPRLNAGWNLLGSILAARGDPEAERAYRRAIAAKPDHPESHYNLGVTLQQMGRADEAIACYRKALQLRPAFASAHNNLANALKARGRFEEALAHYAEAVRADPDFADGWSNLGAALREAGRVEEAIAALERAVALAPGSWAALSNLGIAYWGRNRFEEAAACHRRVIALRPEYAEARGNLGNALAGLGRTDEAEACFREALAAAPDAPDVHSNFGLLLQERGDLAGAMAQYERALALQPAHADAINNLGFLLQEQGRPDDAIALYRRALAANPRSARAAYNLGQALLMRFEFPEGWALAERRFDTVPPVAVRRAFAVPELSAADLAQPHRIAIWREQGVGDQLLYATLLPELEAQGHAFVVELDARFKPAFARSHPGWKVVDAEEFAAAFAGCDRHVALGSLPRLLRPSLASFASQPPALLRANAQRAKAYREALAPGGRSLVGISWRSFQPKSRASVARRKSAPLAAFAGLAAREDLRLLDLQYGDTREEREAFAAAGGRLDRLETLDLFNDLDGVLAAIDACDVVVTTSNVTAHLAGAIGKRTLLVYLADQPPFHYWAAPAGTCLWYPPVEVVTARSLGTWTAALARIDALLGGEPAGRE